MHSLARLGALLAVCSLGRTGLADPNAASAPPSIAPPATAPPSTAPPSTAPPATAPAGVAPTAPPTADALRAAAAPSTAAQPAPVVDGRPPTGSMDATARLYAEPVPVWFTGEENETTLVSVYPDWATSGSVPPLAQCRMPCGFQMQRGRYRIEVAETESTLGGSRAVSVEGPSRLVVTPRERAKRTAGLALGIGGAVAVVAGILVFAHGDENAVQDCSSEGCQRVWNAEMTSGVLVLLAGCAMTPIGWVMFGKSFRPAIDVEPARAASRPTGRVGLVPFPGGAGVGGTFVF